MENVEPDTASVFPHDGSVTLQWADPTGVLCELDLDALDLACIEAGEGWSGYGQTQVRRYVGQAAADRLRDQCAGAEARLDQVGARMDELAADHPELKALRPRRRDSDDLPPAS